MEQLQSVALYLVGLPGKIPVDIGRKGNVLAETDRYGLPIVQALVIGQPLCVLLDQVSQPIEDLSLVVSVGLPPYPFEGLSRCFHSPIDICLRSSHCPAVNLFGGGVNNIKRLTALRIDILAIDEKLSLDCLQLLGKLCHRIRY
jgi:hypothetical protein